MNKNDTTPPPLIDKTGKRSKRFWFSALLVVGSLLGILFLLLFVAPVFAEMFSDYGAELPKPTLLVMSASNFMKSYFLLIQLPAIAFGAAIVWGLFELDKKQKKTLVTLIGMVPPVILVILTFAMCLPIFALSSVVS